MTAGLRSLRQQIKQHPYVTGIVVLVVLLVLVLILFIVFAYRFGWDWTGFNSGPIQITITSASKGNYTATVSQPSKTLWDWLQLLIIPAVLGIGGLWLNQMLKSREEKTTEQRAQTERDIALDNQRGVALQTYIDKMSELLVEKQLRESQPEEEMRMVARARTINVLRQLNSERKGYVIQFLYETHLLSERIIDLTLAELSEANLYNAKMSNALLYRSNLKKAILFKADLKSANLSEACLVSANLQEAELGEANLYRAYLTSANLRGAMLRKADLREADLHFATLRGATLIKANLRDADLSEANLHSANLRDADLSEADLHFANLRDADLRSADLSGVILHGANLKGAIGITAEELEEKAKSLKGATMPDGFTYP